MKVTHRSLGITMEDERSRTVGATVSASFLSTIFGLKNRHNLIMQTPYIAVGRPGVPNADDANHEPQQLKRYRNTNTGGHLQCIMPVKDRG
jgi:hypothetical protein